MWWVLGSAVGVFGLAIAYTWWDRRADRSIEGKLRSTQVKLTETLLELDNATDSFHVMRADLLDKIEDLEHVIAIQRQHIGELESLVVDVGGDLLHVHRLRSELRPTMPNQEAADSDTDDEGGLPEPTPTPAA